jgi:Undecaprenyl-phosphate glucose phosphotransferase
MHLGPTKEILYEGHRGLAFNSQYVVGIVAILDIAAMLLFFTLSYMQAQSSLIDNDLARVWKVTDATFCVSILYLMMASGGYREESLNNPYSQVSRILVNGMLVACLEWGALSWLDLVDEFQWPWQGPINLVSGGVLCMCVIRFVSYNLVVSYARKGNIVRSVAVVGGGEHGQRLIEALWRRRAPWTHLIGIFDDRVNRMAGQVGGWEIHGTVEDLVTYARDYRVDEIIVALPWGAEQRLLDVLGVLKVIPANVRLAPDIIGHHFLDQGFGRIDGVPVYNIFRKPIGGWGPFLKRAEDVFLGSIILLVALPIMLVAAIAIKIESSGPVLFRQNRYGYNNKLIGVYKFRSMYHEMRDENCEQQTTKNDPRITRVGAFLRRTSIDELPQLLNVMQGDMSLVGPRPHAVNTRAGGKLFHDVVLEYAARHKVKPGITGWAQVNGWRGETDTEEKIIRRVECDLFYMENWSIFLDIEIMFRTFMVVMGRNVY